MKPPPRRLKSGHLTLRSLLRPSQGVRAERSSSARELEAPLTAARSSEEPQTDRNSDIQRGVRLTVSTAAMGMAAFMKTERDKRWTNFNINKFKSIITFFYTPFTADHQILFPEFLRSLKTLEKAKNRLFLISMIWNSFYLCDVMSDNCVSALPEVGTSSVPPLTLLHRLWLWASVRLSGFVAAQWEEVETHCFSVFTVTASRLLRTFSAHRQLCSVTFFSRTLLDSSY